jgi:hypothetical protein
LRNLRNFWGYFNSQLEKETQNFVDLQFGRIVQNIESYVKGLNDRINCTLSTYIDLSTKTMLLTAGVG